MSVLKIIKAIDERLKQKSIQVTQFDQTLKNFANDMLETFFSSDACGLASTQVEDYKYFNYNKIQKGYRAQPNLILVSEDATETNMIIAVNPEIIENSEKTKKSLEGCLSIPNQSITIERFIEVTVKYQDLDGKEIIKTYSDMEAIIMQHEIDHLNGILMTDRLSAIKKETFWKNYKHNLNKI